MDSLANKGALFVIPLSCQWKIHLDSKPAQIPVGSPNFSTEGVYEALANTQSQATAAMGAGSRPVYPVQSVKQVGQSVFRDTGSGILERQYQAVCGARLFDHQDAGCIRITQGIFQQIGKDLPQAAGITEDGDRAVVSQVMLNRNMMFREALLEMAEGLT